VVGGAGTISSVSTKTGGAKKFQIVDKTAIFENRELLGYTVGGARDLLTQPTD